MKEKIIKSINEVLSSGLSIKLYKELVTENLTKKIIKLSIEDIPLELLLNFNDDKISVLTDSDHQDVEISGTLSSFIFYASTGGSDLFSSQITITGDIESANALNSFFKESNLLRIIIIELIGQKPTSTLFSIFDPLKNKLKESNESNNESLSNFLKYDINLIPTKQEINDYLDQVDEIKTRTCLLYTSPSPRDLSTSRMPSSA